MSPLRLSLVPTTFNRLRDTVTLKGSFVSPWGEFLLRATMVVPTGYFRPSFPGTFTLHAIMYRGTKVIRLPRLSARHLAQTDEIEMPASIVGKKPSETLIFRKDGVLPPGLYSLETPLGSLRAFFWKHMPNYVVPQSDEHHHQWSVYLAGWATRDGKDIDASLDAAVFFPIAGYGQQAPPPQVDVTLSVPGSERQHFTTTLNSNGDGASAADRSTFSMARNQWSVPPSGCYTLRGAKCVDSLARDPQLTDDIRCILTFASTSSTSVNVSGVGSSIGGRGWTISGTFRPDTGVCEMALKDPSTSQDMRICGRFVRQTGEGVFELIDEDSSVVWLTLEYADFDSIPFFADKLLHHQHDGDSSRSQIVSDLHRMIDGDVLANFVDITHVLDQAESFGCDELTRALSDFLINDLKPTLRQAVLRKMGCGGGGSALTVDDISEEFVADARAMVDFQRRRVEAVVRCDTVAQVTALCGFEEPPFGISLFEEDAFCWDLVRDRISADSARPLYPDEHSEPHLPSPRTAVLRDLLRRSTTAPRAHPCSEPVELIVGRRTDPTPSQPTEVADSAAVAQPPEITTIAAVDHQHEKEVLESIAVVAVGVPADGAQRGDTAVHAPSVTTPTTPQLANTAATNTPDDLPTAAVGQQHQQKEGECKSGEIPSKQAEREAVLVVAIPTSQTERERAKEHTPVLVAKEKEETPQIDSQRIKSGSVFKDSSDEKQALLSRRREDKKIVTEKVVSDRPSTPRPSEVMQLPMFVIRHTESSIKKAHRPAAISLPPHEDGDPSLSPFEEAEIDSEDLISLASKAKLDSSLPPLPPPRAASPVIPKPPSPKPPLTTSRPRSASLSTETATATTSTASRPATTRPLVPRPPSSMSTTPAPPPDPRPKATSPKTVMAAAAAITQQKPPVAPAVARQPTTATTASSAPRRASVSGPVTKAAATTAALPTPPTVAMQRATSPNNANVRTVLSTPTSEPAHAQHPPAPVHPLLPSSSGRPSASLKAAIAGAASGSGDPATRQQLLQSIVASLPLAAHQANSHTALVKAGLAKPTTKLVDNQQQRKGPEVPSGGVGGALQVPSDGIITRQFVTDLINSFKKKQRLYDSCVHDVLVMAADMLSREPNVLDLDTGTAKLTVCGDTHGQFFDVLNVFEMNGYPSADNRYLFNGDFVDRGKFGMENALTLFAFKLWDPRCIHLLRGNHENLEENMRYGFHGELKQKYPECYARMFDAFLGAFEWLPLCAVVQFHDQRILVLHGGIWDDVKLGTTLDDIRRLDRNCAVEDNEVIRQMLWNDPGPDPGWNRSPSRGSSVFEFGPDVTEGFLNRHQLSLVIRSHQVVVEGIEVLHDGMVVTVFSCPKYQGFVQNEGAYIVLDPQRPNLRAQHFQAVRRPHTNVILHCSPSGVSAKDRPWSKVRTPVVERDNLPPHGAFHPVDPPLEMDIVTPTAKVKKSPQFASMQALTKKIASMTELVRFSSVISDANLNAFVEIIDHVRACYNGDGPEDHQVVMSKDVLPFVLMASRAHDHVLQQHSVQALHELASRDDVYNTALDSIVGALVPELTGHDISKVREAKLMSLGMIATKHSRDFGVVTALVKELKNHDTYCTRYALLWAARLALQAIRATSEDPVWPTDPDQQAALGDLMLLMQREPVEELKCIVAHCVHLLYNPAKGGILGRCTEDLYEALAETHAAAAAKSLIESLTQSCELAAQFPQRPNVYLG